MGDSAAKKSVASIHIELKPDKNVGTYFCNLKLHNISKQQNIEPIKEMARKSITEILKPLCLPNHIYILMQFRAGVDVAKYLDLI